MKHYKQHSWLVRVKFPWWNREKRVEDRYGILLTETDSTEGIRHGGGEYVIKPDDASDDPNDVVLRRKGEFDIISVDAYKKVKKKDLKYTNKLKLSKK